MNKTKQGYVAPLSDLLVVRFEENIMSTASSSAMPSFIEDSEEDW